MEKSNLKHELIYWRKRHNKGQKCWSVAHHVSVFGSIICSISAGALLEVGYENLKQWAPVLTSIAAALTSLAASGGFERKWRSNRLSRSRIDCLLIDIEDDNSDLSEIKRQLKEIITQHDQEIVKEELGDSKNQADKQVSASSLDKKDQANTNLPEQQQ